MKHTKLMAAIASAGLIAASATAAVNIETDYDRQDNSARTQPWERAVQDADGAPKGPQSLFQQGQAPVEVDGAALISGIDDGDPVNVEDMIANSSTISGIQGDIASNTTRINDNAILINANRALSESEMQALQDQINDLEGSAGGTPSVPSVFVTEYLGAFATPYMANEGTFSRTLSYLEQNRSEEQTFSYDGYSSLCDIYAIYEVQQTTDGTLDRETAVYKDAFTIDRLVIPSRRSFASHRFEYIESSVNGVTDLSYNTTQRRIIEEHTQFFGGGPAFPFTLRTPKSFSGSGDIPAIACPDQQS